MNYSHGGVTATSGVAKGIMAETGKEAGAGLPCQKLLVAILVPDLFGLAWLALNGY